MFSDRDRDLTSRRLARLEDGVAQIQALATASLAAAEAGDPERGLELLREVVRRTGAVRAVPDNVLALRPRTLPALPNTGTVVPPR